VRGAGTEFQGFKRYQAGDDPRSIEWTIYGRLGQLVTRTNRADAHLRMHLLVDVSRSMSVGTPSKLSCALKLAAALGYVAAGSGDAVGLATFDRHIAHRLAPVTGRSHLLRVLTALEDAAPMAASSISTALMQYGAVERGPGLAIVISDFLDPSGAFEGLRWLLQRGLTPAVAQILSPEEIDPPLSHDTELVDIEDPTASPLLIDAAAIAAYKRALAGLRTSLREFCSTNGLSWIELNSSDSFTDLLRTCERAGVLVRQG
jgi:uncharacterized protein (DUF58 family)